MISPANKKKKKRRPTRLVISDDEKTEARSRSRSDSVSSAASQGKFMSIVPSSANTSPDYPTILLASDNSSSTTSTTSTYNTPSAVPPQTLTDTFIDNTFAPRLDYILPSPTKYSTIYPTTIVIPGPDNPTQPSPPNTNTVRSPTYPTNITISTIVPTLHCSNTATTTTFTTVNTTASTSLVHSTPITSPIPSVTSVLISSPKLAPLFPEHPFQRPITPNKPRPKTIRQTTTDTDTDTDQMDFASAYVLAKNKRTRSPTSPTSTNPPKRIVKKTTRKNKQTDLNAITTDSDKDNKKTKPSGPPPAITQPPATKPTTTTATATKNTFPPIFIYTSSHSQTITYLNNSVTPTPTYKFNNSALVCHAKTAETHKCIVSALKAKKIEHFTYNLQSFRPHKVVVKYMPLDTPNDDIETELRQRNLPFHSISRVMVSRGGKRVPSNILLLTIPKEASQAYYAVTDLCHLRVSVTDYVRLDIPQCHRCQKFGHSSQLCSRAHRCVRCGAAHEGEPCTAGACKCANCGGEHPASYRGCPSYLVAKDRFPNPTPPKPAAAPTPNLTAKQQQNPPLPRSTAVPPTKTQNTDAQPTPAEHWTRFRAGQTSTNATKTQTKTDDNNPFREIINFIKSLNLTDIFLKIKQTIDKLRTATDATDKLFIIIEAVSAFFA